MGGAQGLIKEEISSEKKKSKKHSISLSHPNHVCRLFAPSHVFPRGKKVGGNQNLTQVSPEKEKEKKKEKRKRYSSFLFLIFC
jgi:hypothetical protein